MRERKTELQLKLWASYTDAVWWVRKYDGRRRTVRYPVCRAKNRRRKIMKR